MLQKALAEWVTEHFDSIVLVKGSRLGRRLADGRIQPEKRHQNDNSVFWKTEIKVLQHSLQVMTVHYIGVVQHFTMACNQGKRC